MKKFPAILLMLVFLVAGLFIGARVAIDNAILVSDLDADGHKILNLPADQPLPPPVIVDGSITNASVAADAAIAQTKLALTGTIPTGWLGTTATTAAQGSAAEYTANKGVASGYASLDGAGRIPTSQLPASAGTGTVTTVSVVTANGISGSIANATNTPAITLSLASIVPTAATISGTAGAGFLGFTNQSADPTGYSTLKMWSDAAGSLSFASTLGTNNNIAKFLATGLSATRIYTLPNKAGTVQLDSDIPTTMVGVGGTHKGGLVIDPGASGTNTDYLARDATWKSAGTFSAPSYQPVWPTPTIFPTTNTTGSRQISFSNPPGNSTFYEINSNTGPFLPGIPNQTVPLPAGSTIYVYQAAPGWTNSNMASYTNPNP